MKYSAKFAKMKTFNCSLLLLFCLIVTEQVWAQDKKLARVQRLDGVEVYILSEPIRDYEIVASVQTGIKAESILTGGLFNESITDKVLQYIRRARKQGSIFDAVLYSGGKSIITIKFLTPSNSNNRNVARVRDIDGVDVYILAEPLIDIETMASSGGDLKWKSYLSAGLVNNSIEEDISGFIKKQRGNGVNFDGIIYNGGKSAVSFKYKANNLNSAFKANTSGNRSNSMNQREIQQQNEPLQTNSVPVVVKDKTAPVISFFSPKEKYITTSNSEFLILGKVQDESKLKEITVNNKSVEPEDNHFETNLTLKMGVNKITVTATDIQGNRSLKEIVITRKNAVNTVTNKPYKKIDLHIVSVGISKYKNPKMNLQFAHKDAQDLANAWSGQTEIYNVKETILLINEQATRENIRNSLQNLIISPTGLLVFIFSGHGFPGGLTTYGYSEKDRVGTSLTEKDLKEILETLDCNHICLMDACNSGSFVARKDVAGSKAIVSEEDAIASMVRALGDSDKAQMIVGSSAKQQESYECIQCENGYFTQCFLDVFDNKKVNDSVPDRDGDGYVETFELDLYLKEAIVVSTQKEGHRQNVRTILPVGFHFPIIKIKTSK